MPGHFAAQAHIATNLRERPVLVVVEEEIDTDVSDQDIRIAVVIEVGYCYARSPVVVRQTGAHTHLFEMAVADVVIKIQTAFTSRRDAAGNDGAEIIHCGTVDYQQIHQTVAVEIEPRGSGAVSLRNPFLFGAAATNLSTNAALCSDVHEANRCVGDSGPSR